MTPSDLAALLAADRAGTATDAQREVLYDLADVAARCPALAFAADCPMCRICRKGRGAVPGRPTLAECLECVVTGLTMG